MSKKDTWADTGKFTVTTEHREDIFSLGDRRIGVYVEIHRDSEGDIIRPFNLPPIVMYDTDTLNKLYEAWPDPDGKFREREIPEEPSEIYYTESNARMVWYDRDGNIDYIVDIDPRDRALTYGLASVKSRGGFHKPMSSYFKELAVASTDPRKPKMVETHTPSPMHLALKL